MPQLLLAGRLGRFGRARLTCVAAVAVIALLLGLSSGQDVVSAQDTVFAGTDGTGGTGGDDTPAVDPTPGAPEPGTSGSQGTGQGTGSLRDPMARVIVEFRDVPVVRVPGIPRDARQKLVLTAPTAVSWRNRLRAQQAQFRSRLATICPAAAVDWTYQLAYNGAAVRIPHADLPLLASMPAVRKIWPQRTYFPTMDHGRTITGAETLWDDVDHGIGGEANAGAGVKVAIVDSGVYIPHEFFDPTGYSYPTEGGPWPKEGTGNEGLCTEKVIAARHFFRADDPVDTSQDYDNALDGYLHGTHCAGTVGGIRLANPLNGADPDITGIAPACWLMAYKMLYTSQKGEASVYDGEAIAALEAVLDDGADVVSNSWGHPVAFNVTREPMIITGSNLVHAGLVVVYANGNSASEKDASTGSPACNPDVISVGAAGNGDGWALWRLTTFSSLGPNLDFGIKPDITAPGKDVLSSIHTGTDSLNDEYMKLQGTSMACPHIAGCAALLKQVHPDWTPGQVKSALMTAAGRNVVKMPDNTGPPARVNYQGAGNVQVDESADPGLTVDRPSVSFGLMRNTDTGSYDITLTNLTATDETFTISLTANVTGPNASVTVTPNSSILVPANGTATITLAADATGVGASTGEQEGDILLTGDQGHTAHIIWWLRVVPATGNTPLLLIDYDQNTGANYQNYYTDALDAAGASYDVWDVLSAGRFPNYDELMAYQAVLLFSGEFTGSTSWNQTVASRFLQWIYDGRSFAALGRRLPGLIEPRPFGKIMQMRTDGHADMYGGAIPEGSIVGQAGSPFAGMTFDIEPGGGGGDNADFNTQLLELPPEYIFIPDLASAALVASSPTNQNYEGQVALWRAASPDIDDPDVPADFPFRVLYCTFGLESISDDTGYNTRQDFAAALTTWLTESVTVTLDASISYRVADASVVISGLGGATVTDISFNFDDGTVKSGASTEATHSYSANGTYNVVAAVTTDTGFTYFSNVIELTAAGKSGGGSGGGGCGVAPAGTLPWPGALLALLLVLVVLRRRA